MIQRDKILQQSQSKRDQLVDSSLVISFADRLQGEAQERHVRAMLELLRSSEMRYF